MNLEVSVKIFPITAHSPGGLGRHLALAIALAAGTALVGTLGLAEPAHAQKRDKKKKEDEAPKPVYSKEFVAAYQPLNEALNAEGTDLAALKPQVLALAPLALSADEQLAGGGLIYNAGVKTQDRDLQLQGMELMLASGKVPPEQLGRYNFIVFQLANEKQDYAKARTYLQRAIDNNFTTETITPDALQITMAESYFSANEFAEGLDYLKRAIDARKAQGQPVDAQWYRRGITVAYNNQITPQVYDFVVAWLGDYPTPENWRDAVNLTRNLNGFEGPEILDLLRLSKRVDALKDKQDYILYVEAADPRRLPKEVKDLIDEAYASGAISKDDIYIADSLATANARIASDRADLPALERDASAPSAQLRTVAAAGSAFLSYGEHGKAAQFFEKSLGMPGVDRNESLLRLGIAQVGLGNYAAAQESFAKVEGSRVPIARLWSAYAAQQAGGGVNAAAAAPATGA